jgi:hypothetical protein
MQNMKAALTAGQSGLANRPVFNVVLAHDEYAGGIRAKEVFDALVRDGGELFSSAISGSSRYCQNSACSMSPRRMPLGRMKRTSWMTPPRRTWFTEIPRGIDKWLWFVEAHSQAPK